MDCHIDRWPYGDDLSIVQNKVFGTRMSEFKSKLSHLLVMVLSQVTIFCTSVSLSKNNNNSTYFIR